MARISKEINEQTQAFHGKNVGLTISCLYCRGQMILLKEGLWHCTNCQQEYQRGFSQYSIQRDR